MTPIYNNPTCPAVRCALPPSRPSKGTDITALNFRPPAPSGLCGRSLPGAHRLCPQFRVPSPFCCKGAAGAPGHGTWERGEPARGHCHSRGLEIIACPRWLLGASVASEGESPTVCVC